MNKKLLLVGLLYLIGTCQAMNQPDQVDPAAMALENAGRALVELGHTNGFTVDNVHALLTGRHSQLALRGVEGAVRHIAPEVWQEMINLIPADHVDSFLFVNLDLTGVTPEVFDHFTRVEGLVATHCTLDQNALRVIVEHLPVRLRTFVITRTAVTQLPALDRFEALSSVDVSFNHIDARGFIQLSRTLPASVVRLDVSHNPLGAIHGDEVAELLPLRMRLRVLSLAGTGIHAGDLDEIIAALPETILDLDLSENPDFGLPAAGQIGRFVHLDRISLHGNTITDAEFATLVAELPPTVRVLGLNGNPLHTIPVEIARLGHLRRLDLDGTQLTPEAVVAVANVLPASLMTISVRHNPPFVGFRLEQRRGLIVADRVQNIIL